MEIHKIKFRIQFHLLGPIGLFCLSIFLSYKLVFFVGEKFFFDKLFYQKSIKYGYGASININDLNKFGKRSVDLIKLDNDYKNMSHQKQKINFDKFTIAIIGDSYVWGNGIKENERFSAILEKKMNKIRPTKILKLGFGGDSLLDYFARYEKVKNTYKIDLYIISMVTNDALFNIDNRLMNNDFNGIIHNCQNQYTNTDIQYTNADNNPTTFLINMDKSWQNIANLCVINELTQKLPNNSIYFATEDYFNNDKNSKIYQDYLTRNNKYVISSSLGANINKYHIYFNNYKNFHVSAKEPHPSILANQMYADILFNEITTNPKWNFKK